MKVESVDSARIHGIKHVEKHLHERISQASREVDDEAAQNEPGRHPLDRFDPLFFAVETAEKSSETMG